VAKKASLTTITSVNNNSSTLNANFTALNNALDNTVSRDGSTPNTLTADLDTNSQKITNADEVRTTSLFINGTNVVSAAATPRWMDTWTTATEYSANDLVIDGANGANTTNVYICLVSHTSGTWSSDLSGLRWTLFTQSFDETNVSITGGSISGITDLAVADGGTGSSTASAARTALGTQAQDAALDDIAGITQAAGDVLYSDGSNIQKLAIGTASQVLTVNSGATAPEWATASGGSGGGAAEAQSTAITNATSWTDASVVPIGTGANAGFSKTQDNTKGFINVQCLGGGVVTRMLSPTIKPSTGADFDIVARINSFIPGDTFGASGIYILNGADTKSISFGIVTGSSQNPEFAKQQWTADTFDSEVFSGGSSWYLTQWRGFMRIKRVSTTFSFLVSMDGLAWYTLFTDTTSGWLSDATGFGLYTNATSIGGTSIVGSTLLGLDSSIQSRI